MPQQPQYVDLVESMKHVQAGGLPIRAKMRLADETRHHLFTSDLSVSEFYLSRDVKCSPISQVMGSSIFHIGKIADYKGNTGEIETISQAHRDSRKLALSRCFQEAQMLQADAVIGMRLQERLITMGKHGKGGDDGDEIIEFTVFGTAVRAPWITHDPGMPVITDLSGQDLWALAQDGFEPCGFLFEFCRYHGWHVTSGSGGFGELDDAKTVVDAARQIATTRMVEQAARMGAEFVIGSDVSIKVREVPCGFAKCTRDDLDVDVSWFGTGIRRIGPARRVTHDVPPLLLSMMTVRRGQRARDNRIGDEEDDADEVERAAEEAEELALQADEDLSTGDD